MRILLLGCGGNAGINFVKSLRMGHEDVFVYGLDTNKYTAYLANCDEYEVVNFENTQEKIAYLKNIVNKNDIQFIHAQPDPEVKFLLDNQISFPRIVFPLSEKDHAICANKELFQKLISKKLDLGYQSYNLVEVLRSPNLLDELKELCLLE